jgi:RNA polymerase sigma-70 factor, ECF subfamily
MSFGRGAGQSRYMATAMTEHALLSGAQAGDEGAFNGLVESYRSELHAHCYRMLGSVHDAEDALQDALLRAWKGLARFEGRSSLRAWLYRIATNACLDLVGRRPKRILPVDYGPSAHLHQASGTEHREIPWLEPYPDLLLQVEDEKAAPEARFEQREALELAFVAALQHLQAKPRAVLILREVLGFSARETADLLDTSVAAVNSALQRARKAVAEQLPARTQQATLRELGDERATQIVERYMDAMERGDIDDVVALLTSEPTWSMPPLTVWYHGAEVVRTWLLQEPLTVRWRHVPTQANGQPAVACYAWDEERGCYVGWVVDVLTLEDDRIASITAFIGVDVVRRFGLPETLPVGS